MSKPRTEAGSADVHAFLHGYSIEVMPRTAEKVEDFRALLPDDTRVYIAHIEGTPIADMVATARRLAGDGYTVMPHSPARIFKDAAQLQDWIARHQGEAGVKQGLILAGSRTRPLGEPASSMQLLETGLFDKAGFKRLHLAGHPEGNRDIDADDSDTGVMHALRWKQQFAERTDAKVALATLFCFEAKPIIEWVNALQAAGIDLPVHIGIAGPAKLQTPIKFAIACGIGASLKDLQKRAMDVTKLILAYEPNQVIAELVAHKAASLAFNIAQVHFFPHGGIKTNATSAINHGGANARPAKAA